MMLRSKTYIYNIETEDVETILDSETGTSLYLVADWSPDSSKLLFQEVYDFDPSLMLYDQATGNMSEWIKGEDAAWSPDNKIVFVTDEVRTHTSWLHTLDVVSATQFLVQEFKSTQITGLSWLPNEQGIVFASRSWINPSQEFWAINFLNLETGAVQTIADGQKYFSPLASPVADIVVFIEMSPYLPDDAILFVYTIHLINADGSCDYKIPGVRSAWAPAWSPDGTKLAFAVGQDIYVVDLIEVFGQDFPSSGLPCD